MFTIQLSGKKRRRQEKEQHIVDFEERHMKRQNIPIPHKNPQILDFTGPIISYNKFFSHKQTPSTVSTGTWDSEEDLKFDHSGTFLPSCASSSGSVGLRLRSNSFSSCLEKGNSTSCTCSTKASSIVTHLDDLEMSDSPHILPSSSRLDSADTFPGRTPTPIYSSFPPLTRANKMNIYTHSVVDLVDINTVSERANFARRLPSPISEGELSPSIISAGLSDMQMEIEPSPLLENRTDRKTKRNLTSLKHSIKIWTTGYDGGTSQGGIKKSFSMGYRADCEKCRLKVPGHFSHIVAAKGL